MTGKVSPTHRSSRPLTGDERWSGDVQLGAAVLVYALAPLAVAWLQGQPGVDVGWDFLMALGLVATGGCAVLPLMSARWWAGRHRDPELLRLVQRLHRQLSYVMTACVLAHVVGVLVLEPRTLDYLLPTAPGYMLAGLLSLLLLAVIIATSREGPKQRWPQASWRRWHAAFSALALAGLIWHLVGSGFWFSGAGAGLAIAWLVGVPTGLGLYWRNRRPRGAAGPRVSAGRAAKRRVLSGLLLLLLLACAWFAWSSHSKASREANPLPCPAGRCL